MGLLPYQIGGELIAVCRHADPLGSVLALQTPGRKWLDEFTFPSSGCQGAQLRLAPAPVTLQFVMSVSGRGRFGEGAIF